jgi:hypothetical protein
VSLSRQQRRAQCFAWWYAEWRLWVVTPKERRWKHAPKREFTRRQRRAEARDWARVSWALQEPP